VKKIIFFIFIIFTSIVYSNDNIVIERSSFALRLNIDENNYWEWTVPQSPYVFNENHIQFYPEEILFIEAEVVNNIVVELTVVNEVINENKTIIIKFNQITNRENPRIHGFMMLEIHNPFNKILEYSGGIYLVQQNRWVNLRSIPVQAELISYQSFPDVIGAMVLHDFVLR